MSPAVFLLALQTIVTPPFQAPAIEPSPSIHHWGWHFPGVERAYRTHERRTRGVVDNGKNWFFDTERSRVFIETGVASPADYTPVLVATATRTGNEARIKEELVVVQSWTSYAESGSKPYCFRVLTTPFQLNRPVDAVTYAIYDHDGDGNFEELEEVESLDSEGERKWRPRPRLGPTPRLSGSGQNQILTSVMDTGWRVPGWSGISSASPTETWEVRAGDVVVKAESTQSEVFDSSWVVTAMETRRGLAILRDSIVAREVVRYRLPNGRTFCVWVRAGPWTFSGMQAAEWAWAYYDTDGDGDFELLASAGDALVGRRLREWVPRLPDRLK